MALTRFHLHLVSDSTGDTVHSVARACLVQFDETQAIEHVWSMVRTRAQIERVIAGVEANPGVVLFTMVNEALRQILQDGCRRLQVPTIPVLDPVIGALGSYLGRESRGMPGKQHLLDNEYFARIDAMTFRSTTMTASRPGASTTPMSVSSACREARRRRPVFISLIAGSRPRTCRSCPGSRCRRNCSRPTSR